jgi:hypothetical protein
MTIAQLRIIARDVEKLRDMLHRPPPTLGKDAFLESLSPQEFVEVAIILSRMDNGIVPGEADAAFLNALAERFDARKL